MVIRAGMHARRHRGDPAQRTIRIRGRQPIAAGPLAATREVPLACAIRLALA